jgi:hypothetical protein
MIKTHIQYALLYHDKSKQNPKFTHSSLLTEFTIEMNYISDKTQAREMSQSSLNKYKLTSHLD